MSVSNPFTPEIVGWAQAAEGVYQIPSSLSLSAAMLESSLGAHTPPGTNNWFGIKDASAAAAAAVEILDPPAKPKDK